LHPTHRRKRIPILSGEWGYSATTLSPLRQATIWHGNGSQYGGRVPVSIWYDWHDDGQDAKKSSITLAPSPGVCGQNRPIRHEDLTTQRNGGMPQGRINVTDENDFVLLFTKRWDPVGRMDHR
jgi:hypothetical protein